ncbi:MAG: RsmB/NOP family class I SAM-dependent RNA methyltransferase, partial [Wujia sp.]
TVQDESSMAAVRAAGIKPGNFVMDVCAAPGGKTTAAAVYAGVTGRVLSMDIAEDKLEKIAENVSRQQLENVEIRCHDAREFEAEYVESADVVIADVLCSGLGILGRKNDIKYRVSKEQLEELIQIQRNILDVVCRYVKPGGTLLYSTCTINPDENERQVDWFLAGHPEFSLRMSRQFLQGIDQCDGFYYAVMQFDGIKSKEG